MENSTQLNSTVQNRVTDTPQNDIIYLVICPLVSLIGLILNLISIAIISNFKEPLYYYLRLELMFQCSDLLVTVLKPIYFCRTCWLSTTFFSNLYYLVFNVYMASVFELGAIMSRNMSAFICVLLISKNFREVRFALKKSFCKIFALAILILSYSLYTYQLFEYKIVPSSSFSLSSNLSLVVTYEVTKTEFGMSYLKSYIEILVMAFRDAINVAILFCFNLIIIFITKANVNEKKNILANSNRMRANYFERYLEYCNNTALIRRLAHKENRQTVMMILTCLNSLIGRLPILFFFIKKNIIQMSDKNTKYAALMVYFSYSINFFLYYQSNYKFRKLFNLYACKIFFCVNYITKTKTKTKNADGGRSGTTSISTEKKKF